jgi:hypothetical protein
MIIIMWARVCIVLHNLIIRIEGNNFDDVERADLVRRGLHEGHGHAGAGGDGVDEDDPGDDLEQARRRLETPGQRFRVRLMSDLFDSPSCNATRRPD